MYIVLGVRVTWSAGTTVPLVATEEGGGVAAMVPTLVDILTWHDSVYSIIVDGNNGVVDKDSTLTSNICVGWATGSGS